MPPLTQAINMRTSVRNKKAPKAFQDEQIPGSYDKNKNKTNTEAGTNLLKAVQGGKKVKMCILGLILNRILRSLFSTD